LSCLDIGASTGGFTDCLLRHGAAGVWAVDVGRNLMDPKLRRDERVRLIEGLNARHLAAGLPGPPDFDLAVMDVSFISLELILPQAAGLVRPEGRLLALVKPQFEVGRAKVGKKGVVRDPEAIRAAVDKISALGPALVPPFRELGRAPSRLTGAAGNQEIFVLFGSCQF
jgi:23S rRNA (cytidine1920-2'-O)/16S rRNA (cytidine1409-2'-O)-methyltransferase